MDPSSVEARRLYVKAFYPGRRKAHGGGFLPRRREAWWTRGVSLPDASRASDRKDSTPQ